MSFFSNRKQSEVEIERDEKQAVKPVVPQHPIGFDTVLGATSKLEGTLHSEGNVRLDGEFSGTLEIKGNILVGETAKITADINARNISIAGAVRGNVIGNKVQLLRTGRIWGDITANALTTEEGAFIDGKITMKGHSANPVEPVRDIAKDTAPVAPKAEEVPTVMVELPVIPLKGDDETQEKEAETLAVSDDEESND
jgi:cytoskeletal protein CcmA (bactofilin family)